MPLFPGYWRSVLCYPAFMVTACCNYCMGAAELVLFCIFSCLCLLYPVYSLCIEVSPCCRCTLHLDGNGIYTVISVIRLSMVFCRTHPVSVSAGNTDRRYRRCLRDFIHHYHGKRSDCRSHNLLLSKPQRNTHPCFTPHLPKSPFKKEEIFASQLF